MMTQPLAGAKSVVTENELDIRGLFRVLWAGKLWIAGIALGFALLRWPIPSLQNRSGAPRQSPTDQRLTCWGDYSQQQFLRNLDIKANLATPIRLPLWMKPIKSL
jgi:lipopolysaccharide biosynthesis protein WzzE